MVSISSNADAATVAAATVNATTGDAASKSAAPGTAVALTASGKPKEKRRNNEKRKEKSRDAARCRRSRETEIFSELAQLLPLEKGDVNQLDKASVMRIAIAYLKVREMLHLFPKIQELVTDIKIDTDADADGDANGDSISSTSSLSKSASQLTITTDDSSNSSFNLLKCAEASQLMKQTLDGFLIILSNDGDITYVSDNITEYLGIAKIDILGQQIWEYSHQCDHAELKEAINVKRNGLADKVKDEHMLEEGLSTDRRELFVRFKCTLTSRGRSINIKSASYKVIHITGHLVVNVKGDRVLIAIGRPIPHPSNIEVPLGITTFLTKHSLDMKFTYVDDKMQNLFGYKPEDLLEKSLFDCHHGADSDSLMATFKNVLSKGQGETCRYRFLGKHGGYCWILTQATIVYDKLKPQSVVCVNYVISQLENNNEIYSLAQYEASNKQKTEETNITTNNNNNNNNNNNINNVIKNDDSIEQQSPITVTTIDVNQNGNNNQQNSKIEVTVKACSSSSSSEQQTQPAIALNTTNNNNNDNENDSENEDKAKINVADTSDGSNVKDNSNTNNNTNVVDNIADNSIKVNAIKCEQLSIDLPTPATIPIPTTTPTATTIPIPTTATNSKPIENTNNNNKSFVIRDSVSPVSRNLQSNCLIGNNKPKLIEEKRPKSVTASVFRAPPQNSKTTIIRNSNLNTTNNNKLPIIINNINKTNNAKVSAATLSKLNAAATGPAATPRAQSVTASVFTPISQLPNKQQQHIVRLATATAARFCQQQQQQQDMNKGFLSFTEDATELTMLKEEPDELTHLSTTGVDSCMPLDDTVPLFGEMLAGLMGSYGSLLPDDINSLDSTTSSTTDATHNCSSNSNYGNIHNASNNNSNTANNAAATTSPTVNSNSSNGNNKNNGLVDPFINYREESNDTNCSQHLLSPSVTSKSPEASSLPSLCSPNSLSQEDEFAFMTMNVDDDIDLTMRAPYIPMNEQDDLPLLTADDLMWCGSNAFSAEDLNMHKDADAMQQLEQVQQHHHHQQQQQQQQQQTCDSNRHLLDGYQHEQLLHQQQQHLNQHFSHSLCSSPASTVSSLSPSPVSQQQQHQQQQQQHETNAAFATDTSELAALLCGSGNGTLSILENNCGGDNNDDNVGNNGIVGSTHQHQHQHHQHHHHHHNQHQQSQCAASNDAATNSVGVVGVFRLQQLQQQLQEQEQQQQREEELLSLTIECKKKKFDAALAPSLCDSIEDSFENVYSKDSTNLDCWNDLLQINVNDNSSSASSPVPSITTTTTTTTKPNSLRQLEDLQQQECKQHLQQQQRQQKQQENMILNAVPLLTIQSNKNLMSQHQQQQQQQQSQRNNNNINNKSNAKMIINDEILSTTSNRSNNAGSNNNSNNKITTIKLVSGATATPVTTGATIRLVENKVVPRAFVVAGRNNGDGGRVGGQTATPNAAAKAAILQAAVAAQQQQQHGSKRHLTTIMAVAPQVETKRLKSTIAANVATVELQATPHLLQQLMAPLQQQKVTTANVKEQQQQQQQQQQRKAITAAQQQHQQQHQRWSALTKSSSHSNVGGDDSFKTSTPSGSNNLTHQQSNSVLKNLLVSGCDEIVCTKDEPIMMIEGNSMEQASSSPLSDSLQLAKPLHCLPPTVSVLRNYRHNPMIGGPGVLPSPTFGSADDTNPPGLTACDTDSASDSGIDELSNSESAVPLKLQLDQNTNSTPYFSNCNANGFDGIQKSENATKGLLLMKFVPEKERNVIAVAPPPLPGGPNANVVNADLGESGSQRKTSISFMDSSNPLLTPFLMDLCNDDYNMNTEPFLEDNEIESVLSEWTHEIV